MNNDEFVARQARRIAELEDALTEHRNSIAVIRSILYCIGGPLNDNKLGYTRGQLEPFFRIAQEVKD